ncbi:MAG: SDR family oxidoreductase [Ignavibacteria bacterium]
MKKKILITGGSGLLGQYLNISLGKDYELLTLYNKNAGNCTAYQTYQVDISDFSLIKKMILEYHPDFVIHTACFSRPESCNAQNRSLVYKVNVEATEVIAQMCEKIGCTLIYTSTDLVYDGNTGGWLTEDSPVNPVSLYAETKLLAEKEIVNETSAYIILRTSLLIGFGLNHSRNNFHLMYQNLKNGLRVKLFKDQIRTPLSLLNAAEMIKTICEGGIPSGIYNFGGIDRVSRVELGEMVCNMAGFEKTLIDAISMDDIPDFPKVYDVSLNTEKLQFYGLKPLPIKQALRQILNQILENVR